MQEWFNNLDARERKVLISGAIVLLIISIYFLGWEPFVKKIDKLQKSNIENQQTLAWMQQRAQEVKYLRRTTAGSKKDLKGQSLLGVLDKTAKSHKLGNAIKRVQPEGTSKAQVRLEKASFNHIIQWVEQLERRQGIRIVNSVIERQSEPGLVNARIIFETGA